MEKIEHRMELPAEPRPSVWCGFDLHKWSTWEQFNQPLFYLDKEKRPVEYVELRQRRHCKLCKYMEIEIV